MQRGIGDVIGVMNVADSAVIAPLTDRPASTTPPRRITQWGSRRYWGAGKARASSIPAASLPICSQQHNRTGAPRCIAAQVTTTLPRRRTHEPALSARAPLAPDISEAWPVMRKLLLRNELGNPRRRPARLPQRQRSRCLPCEKRAPPVRQMRNSWRLAA